MKFSLILPVYNVEKYLAKCLDSCLKQDIPLSEYEIIVVIDGSPDNSKQIAKDYQNQYENIIVIERQNGGLSAARNTGLYNARGEYVWFIDSDDYIMPNILGGIYRVLSTNDLDCCWLQWKEVDEQGIILPPFAPHLQKADETVMSGEAFMANVLSNYLYTWSFVFSRSFLETNRLLFKEGMYYEDTDFAIKFLPLINKIKLLYKVCYLYQQRSDSIVHSTTMSKLRDISQNCKNAYSAYLSQPKPIKKFYLRCYSAFYLLYLKEVIKSKKTEFAELLVNDTKQNHFGKVMLYGNLTTKLIAILYNSLGVETTLKIFRVK